MVVEDTNRKDDDLLVEDDDDEEEGAKSHCERCSALVADALRHGKAILPLLLELELDHHVSDHLVNDTQWNHPAGVQEQY